LDQLKELFNPELCYKFSYKDNSQVPFSKESKLASLIIEKTTIHFFVFNYSNSLEVGN